MQSGVKNELKTYLNKIDLSKEVDRVLAEHDLEITVKFKKKTKAKNHKSS